MALLAATALTAAPARADGGNGGFATDTGGTGATGFTGDTGGSASSSGNGGGGGGAAGGPGGNGGDGGGPAGRAGGTGAAAPGGTGGDGGSNNIANDGGGGGGGGGGNGNGAGAATVANTGTLTGGLGGNGGIGSIGGGIGGGGGGGGGGYGAIVTGSGASSNSGTVTGGNGGTGGNGNGPGGNGGNGGTGGVGVQFSGSGTIFTNTGAVTGGTGGSGGTGSTAGSGGVGGVGIVGANLTVINGGAISGGLSAGAVQADAITFTGGTNVLQLQSGSTITGNVVAFSAADTLALGGSTSSTFDTSQIGSAAQYRNFGLFEKTGAGTWTLTGTPGQTTPWTITQGTLAVANVASLGGGSLTFNGGTLQALGTLNLTGTISLNAGGGTVDTNGNNVTFANPLTGTGGLTKAGIGTLTLSGANTYSGTTTINAGILQLASGASLASALAVNGGVFATNGNVTLASLSGAGGAINLASGVLTVNSTANATLAAAISGAGGLTQAGAGTLSLTGANTYTGPTTVSAGTLAVAGSITSNVTVGSGGTLNTNGTVTGSVTNAGTMSGSGIIVGNVTNAGTLAPGNSIGTLTVNGSYTQSAGSAYQVEVNAAGQSDKLNVSGGATINGGTVAVIAATGTYATSTTYTILTATGGRSGTYSAVSSNLAFLTPSLSYDANDVYLTLALLPSGSNPTSVAVGFLRGATTANQQAVATALNLSVAAGVSGDFATVIGALANLSTSQGSWALNQISGQPIANFGTGNVASNALFMNTLGQQMAVARGAQGTSQRQALAQACEIDACDGTSPFSVWGSLLGGLGSVQGNGNSNTFTYNLGGASSGIDYRLDPRFLIGLGVGYTAGTQWTDSFQGKGWSNAVSVAAYGSFTQSNVYVDALAGYAYSNNQLQQYLVIPGLQPRQANGSTGANAFLGQVETGYRIVIYAPAAATVTPFARFQASSINQAGFTEWGASSLNLTVAQQTTASLRTTLGADLAGTIGPLQLGLRLGWLHEYADTSRPMTAAFAGAPTAAFTVYGATLQRDSAVIGFQASAAVADGASIYARYDGEIGAGVENHALNVGLRLNW